MDDPMSVMVRATRDQIDEFEKLIIWIDIKRELLIWKKAAKDEYDILVSNVLDGKENTASTLTHIGDIHGRVATIDYVLLIPEIFRQALEQRAEDEKAKREMEEEKLNDS